MSIEIDVSIRSRGKPVPMRFPSLEVACIVADILRKKGIRVHVEQELDERFAIKLAA